MPHPKPNPRLMLMPLLMPGTLTTAIPTDTMGMADTMADGADTTVDTTDIPTDTVMLVPTDTMAVTGGKLFTMNSHFI